jgi:uncharacterized alkaline shock family protein YloU
MVMTEQTADEQLPCGRSWDELLEQVARGDGDVLSAHQVTCPHCGAALAELAQVWAPVRVLAAEQVRAPRGLLDRVMHQVRDVARQHWHTVVPSERGSTRVAARVVATLARLAAGRVPGVRVALGRTSDPAAAHRAAAATDAHAWPGAAIGVAGGSTVVDLALAVRYGVGLHELAEQVRRVVVGDLRRLAGLEHVEVNVTIDDVLEPEPGVRS